MSRTNRGKPRQNLQALVTGATGFIGTYLVESLTAAGFRVRVYSRSSYSRSILTNISEDCWFSGSLSDVEQLKAACIGVDVVFHLAGVAESGNTDRNRAISVNTQGSKNVYAACVAAEAKKFIFLSSVNAINPTSSPYAFSKRATEEFLSEYCLKKLGPKTIILRPGTVYGVGMKNYLRTFIRFAANGMTPSLPKFKNVLHLVAVEDLCKIIIRFATNDISEKRLQFHSITDGQEYNINIIEDLVYRHLGRRKPRLIVPKWIIDAAILAATFINNTGLRRNQIGAQLTEKLYGGDKCARLPQRYEFVPSFTLESQMPAIISSLSRN